ncbi:MAG TPA: LysM domain-containing protein [Acidimicrobiales bacterium]
MPAAVYWRRRAAVLFMVVSAAFGGHAALQLLGGGPLAAAEAPSNRGGAAGGAAATVGSGHEVHLVTEPVSRAVYVVGSGDTLWTIARALQPSGDVRPLVDALAAGRSGRPLQPGERIVLP